MRLWQNKGMKKCPQCRSTESRNKARFSPKQAAHAIGVGCVAPNTHQNGEIAAVRNEDGEPEYMGKAFLSDRVPVHHMTVINDVIHVTATIHDEDDPLCCPSQDVTLKFRFEAGEFVVVEE